jgi:hypothetical protein
MAWPEPVGVVTWMGRDILRPRFDALLSRHHPPAAVTDDFAAHHPELVSAGTIGAAPSQLLSMSALIDHAANWFSTHR